MKSLRLLSLLAKRPSEFWLRATAIADARLEPYRLKPPAYSPVDFADLVSAMEKSLRVSFEPILNEPELKELESEIREGIQRIPSNAPFALRHNSDFVLGRLCYVLARVLRPDAVVETGVCYGVTSSFVLKAMKINGTGLLHSIDLPPLGENADKFVGRLVPASLRQHWKLYRGTSEKLLPELLAKIGRIPFFLHDSLHTYRNMLREFQTVTPYLRRPAVLVSDDVQGNAAFVDWVSQSKPECWGVTQEHSKNSLLGAAVLAG